MGAHPRLIGPEPAVSANTTQLYGASPIYCRYVPGSEAVTGWYYLVTEAHVCEQLAQGCNIAVHRLGVKPGTSWSLVQHITNRSTSHTCMKWQNEDQQRRKKSYLSRYDAESKAIVQFVECYAEHFRLLSTVSIHHCSCCCCWFQILKQQVQSRISRQYTKLCQL